MTRTLDAPAKINLTLEILGLRPDGYHELRMVMQSVSLCDRVTVTLGGLGGCVALRMTPAGLPEDARNLAYRAAEHFFRAAALPRRDVEICVEKRIPAAAGLAGGSADAAAVLRALNELTDARLSPEELAALSLPLGADLPFCVLGGTRLACGVGERLSPLPPMPDCGLLLCTPDFPCPTGAVFGAYDAAPVHTYPDTERLAAALARGDLEEIASGCANDLEPVVEAGHPEIGEIRRVMLEAGALGARMSGSGATVYGIFREEEGLRRAEALLRARYARTFAARPANSAPRG